MKKFEFKLQRLLDMRAAREKEIQNELAALVSRQNAEKAKQDELRGKVKDMGGKLREQWRRGTGSSDDALAYWRFEAQAVKAIESSNLSIAGMEPGINATRRRLADASRDKKVVEKLKERKLEEYNYEANREAAKESDDMNQKIYMRKINEMSGGM